MADEHFETPGGIRYSPASKHSQELAKWETRPLPDGSVTQDMINAARRAGVHHGVFEYQEFPKAMYRATQTATGIKLTEERMSAHSEIEERNLMSRGFRSSAQAALDVVTAENQDLAVADAERNYRDQGMSQKARDEAAAAEAATAKHVGDIPAVPVRRAKRETTHA